MNGVESDRIFLQPHLYSDGLPTLAAAAASAARPPASTIRAAGYHSSTHRAKRAGVAATKY